MCDEHSYLLALAHFHKQETGRAYWHLQGNRLPEARYLLAKCCFLMQKWDEAEDALLSGGTGVGGQVEAVNGAAGHFLLGQVREKQANREGAAGAYAKCLEICPFMWEAYDRWSWLILGSTSPSRSSSGSAAAANFTDERLAQGFAHVCASQGQAVNAAISAGARAGMERAATAPLTTPRGMSRQQNAPSRGDREQPHHLSRKERRAQAEPARASNAPVFARGTLGNGLARGTGDSHPSGSATPCEIRDAPGRRQHGEVRESHEVTLAVLLRHLGEALHAMHNFEHTQTIQHLSKLPRRHYETGYVLELVGLCHFESADYKKAEQAFQRVWKIEPRRVEGLEYYSSALWQLRKEVELGHLAQQSLQYDRLAPQVWCVVGNCFSLQKEHDTAIKFFKRAIQVDPSFTYAYTLCGHEFVANEKFDKAIPMYQHALNVDVRHYNAWWGLGNIYHRQEEHESARYHFLKALEINRSNSVLRCYLGMVLNSLNNPLMALENFDRAAQGELQNGMAHFQNACVLMSLDRYEDALKDLKKVHALAPKEACVHFQLGKVYMKLQEDKKALQHFNTAMDLNRDSKDYQTIKTHIERLQIRVHSEAEEASSRHGAKRLSSASSSTAEEDCENSDSRAASGSADNLQFFPGHHHGDGSPRPTHRQGAGNSQQYGGGGSPGGRAVADMASGSGPQTPSVTRGFAPTVNRRLWGRGGTATTGASVHGGSFGATTVSSFPVGSAAGGGRGGSPASWSSPSTGPPLHGPAPGFRF